MNVSDLDQLPINVQEAWDTQLKLNIEEIDKYIRAAASLGYEGVWIYDDKCFNNWWSLRDMIVSHYINEGFAIRESTYGNRYPDGFVIFWKESGCDIDYYKAYNSYKIGIKY